MNPKRSSVYYVFGLCVIGILTPLAVSVMAQSEESIPMEFPEPDAGNLRTFIELVRSDVRTQKAYILAQNMEFTEAEAVARETETKATAETTEEAKQSHKMKPKKRGKGKKKEPVTVSEQPPEEVTETEEQKEPVAIG